MDPDLYRAAVAVTTWLEPLVERVNSTSFKSVPSRQAKMYALDDPVTWKDKI